MISIKKRYNIMNLIKYIKQKVGSTYRSMINTMTETEHVVIIATGVLVFFGLYLMQADSSLFRAYVREDGFVEWLTVVLLFSSAILFLFRAIKLRKVKNRQFLMFLTIASILFFFAGAEEISWGQRIFGFESNTFFIVNNAQKETNIHNLVYQGIKINKLVFSKILGSLIAVYLIILPGIYKRNRKLKRLVDSIAIPVPRNYQIVVFVFLAILLNSIHVKDQWELLEMAASLMFFAIFLNPFNKAIYQLEDHRLKDQLSS